VRIGHQPVPARDPRLVARALRDLIWPYAGLPIPHPVASGGERPLSRAGETQLAGFPRGLRSVPVPVAEAAAVGTAPEITLTVRDDTGVPARAFAQWAADRVADFR
jgi:hypothetical protein